MTPPQTKGAPRELIDKIKRRKHLSDQYAQAPDALVGDVFDEFINLSVELTPIDTTQALIDAVEALQKECDELRETLKHDVDKIEAKYLEENAELRAQLTTKSIGDDALNNSNRKLAEANARIVEFEDIKRGHLVVQKTLAEKLYTAISALKKYADFDTHIQGENLGGKIARECLAKIEKSGGDK